MDETEALESDESPESEEVVQVWRCPAERALQTSAILNRVPIKDVALSQEHALFLATTGLVYSQGSNQYGQLGLGHTENCTEPCLVTTLRDEHIVQIACGSHHSAAVTASGAVYCWGHNRAKQCGQPSPDALPTPALLEVVSCQHSRVKIVSVSCGEVHSLALDSSGQLWSWGTGTQLGLPNLKQTHIPTLVDYFSGRRVVSISCGDLHNVVLVQKVRPQVQVHQYQPSTCKKCKQEIYTMVEQSDVCIITDDHKCPLGVDLSDPADEILVVEYPEPTPRTHAFSRSICHLVDEKEAKKFLERQLSGEFPRRQSMIREKMADIWDSVLETSVGTGVQSGVSGLSSGVSGLSSVVSSGISNVSNTVGSGLSTMTSKVVSNIRGFEVFGGGTSPLRSIKGAPSELSSLEWQVDSASKNTTSQLIGEKDNSENNVVSEQGESPVNTDDIELKEIRTSRSEQDLNQNASLPDLSDSGQATRGQATATSDAVANKAGQQSATMANKTSSKAFERTRLSQSSRASSYDVLADLSRQRLERRKSYEPPERQSPLKTRGEKVEELLEREVNILETVMETEVWSWGKGRLGQLGHGDMLERAHPSCIKAMCNKRIVRVVAGANHCVALSASSEVYTWGDNTYYQLGHKESPSTNPQLIRPLQHSLTWDVAAGPRESLLLCYFSTPQPEICFCGIQDRFITALLSENKMGSESSTSALYAPKRLCQLKKMGMVTRCSASGSVCASILDKSNSSLNSLLHEIALNQRVYLRNLENVLRLVIKPVIISESYQASIVNSAYGDAMTSLLDQYDHVIKLVAMTIVDMTSVIQSRGPVTSCRLLSEAGQYVAVYARYARAYQDVAAMAGFQHVAELAGPLLEKLYDVSADLCGDDVTDLGNHVTVLQHLFYTPLRHVREYSRTARKLALHYNGDSEDHVTLSEAAVLWDSLRDWLKHAHNAAESTCKFWIASVNKNIEPLRVTGRRLLRDSRQSLLSAQNAGRFTNHQFLLFSDVFVHVQYSTHLIYPLETIWVEPLNDDRDDNTSDENGNHGFVLVTPEDRIQLVTPGPSEKNSWFWFLNKAIDAVLSKNKLHQHKSTRIGANVKPPLSRHAKHVFVKAGPMKGASYTGMWMNGKLEGRGELTWPDGRKYTGKFRQGLQHGYGCMLEPKGEEGIEVYDGYWISGKRNGHGQLRYGNGDVFDGTFKDGVRHGHGVHKQGSLKGHEASLYIGEWVNDKRHGYGVLDDILKGEKYMCMWQDDVKHGCGVIVTLDGMYFEGNFSQNKVTGGGLLLTEDNCCYEGEFQQGMTLSGKGTMTLVNGDVIEGTFHGALSDGVRVSGTYRKSVTRVEGPLKRRSLTPKNFAKFSVHAERKWNDIFSAIESKLQFNLRDTNKAWEQVAVVVSTGKKTHAEMSRSTHRVDVEDLETIPVHNQPGLTVEHYTTILAYLTKSFSVHYHPLGSLMNDLVGVYRATYVGMGAHARLLLHAVTEIAAYIKRLYRIIRLLFPELPEHDLPVQVYPRDHQPPITGEDQVRDVSLDEEEGCVIFTPTGMLYTFLLPRVYPPLFTLYALYNETDDDRYLERIQRLNRQTDLALMAYLGVDQRFWHLDKTSSANEQILSLSRDVVYKEAVDALQQISTAFCPADKLHTIRLTFRQLNLWVERELGSDYLWSMDELFPVFQYVVIRARIRHLGAEIHFIDDLMEPHLELGELGLMFTTLKASYFQIQTEKIVL